MVLLLQHGASPDATTKDLYTALHIASKEGHEDVVAVLLDHGANHLLTTKVAYALGLLSAGVTISFVLFKLMNTFIRSRKKLTQKIQLIKSKSKIIHKWTLCQYR